MKRLVYSNRLRVTVGKNIYKMRSLLLGRGLGNYERNQTST